MEISRKKRKVHIGRIVLIIAIPLIIIAGGFGAYKFITKDPYAKIISVQSDNKTAGTMKHDSKEDELYYLSVYYPTFDHTVLNDRINKYRSTIKTDLKQNEKVIISVDYESSELYDSYISITFHQKLLDKQGKVLKDELTCMNYDKKLDKMMDVSDVLRRDYMTLLRTTAKENNIAEKLVTKTTVQSFSINKTGITFYLDKTGSKKLTIPYDANKNYIALTNKSIASLYQKDAVVPVKEANVDPNKPMIAFTFDDGPSDLTTKLMDAFDKEGAKATFFMVGPNVEAREDVVKDMYQRGFELGNHTYSHEVELTTLSKTQLYDEIYKTQDAIFKACGKDANFLRAPFGSYNENVLKASTMTLAYWSIDTEDWKSRNTEAVKKEILANIQDGSVILEHDLYGTSVDAAIELLPTLKEKGYQIVTLSTLMKYKGTDLKATNILAGSLYE